MPPNRSSAVMQQRASPVHDALDDFPTPPWATRALATYLVDLKDLNVWEPACNRLYMANTLTEFAAAVHATDVHDYGRGGSLHDFLMSALPSDMAARPSFFRGVDWIITNPPFVLGAEFALRALDVARRGVALFARCAFTEGQTRFADLFDKTPPTTVAQFTERVLLIKGRLVREGTIHPIKGTRMSTATAYCWLIWDFGRMSVPDPLGLRPWATQYAWIPPCRLKLERPGDYPPLDPADWT